VKWIDAWTQFFDFDFGVRQGSVLSPFLCALGLCLNDLTKFSTYVMFIVLYADDILLISPSYSVNMNWNRLIW